MACHVSTMPFSTNPHHHINMNIYNHIINSLPETPNILGREKYFNSVVFVPFLEINGELNILFQKRAKNIRQGGEICFPGGGIDKTKDSTYKQTAIRETIEELGISRDNIIVEGRMDTLVAPIGAVIEIFVGRITDNNFQKYPFNKSEVEKLFVVPFDFFKTTKPDIYKIRHEIQPFEYDKEGNKINTFPTRELNLPKKYHDNWGGRQSEVYVYKTNGEVIWGLTAMILKHLSEI